MFLKWGHVVLGHMVTLLDGLSSYYAFDLLKAFAWDEHSFLQRQIDETLFFWNTSERFPVKQQFF